jgi:hypothetical protein
MLYDQVPGPPQPGSLLESLFILLAKRRQETEYYKTKLLVASQLAVHSENGSTVLEKAMDDYRDSLFPFLAKQKSKEAADAKKVLNWWGQRMLKIRPLWRATERKGLVSKLRRGQEKVRQAEQLRRHRAHRRI